MSSSPILSVHGLVKTFKDTKAVAGVDLDVRAGECFGLLGPNGAGKTTTIEICEGLTQPDAGDVELFGLRWKTDADALRQKLGIQLQETQLADKLTVRETIELFRSFFRQGPSPAEIIRLVALEDKQGARVRTLSGGQKQRLALACALVGDPELLFLDEPTTGLDPQARRQLWDLVDEFKRTGRTIVLTTHYMEEAERLCERVAIMDQGLVIARGTPRDLIASIGVEHVIECTTTGGPLAVQAITGLPGVREAGLANGALVLQVTHLHEAVPALHAELDRQGLILTELRTRSATLEDVFVALTGRHSRDD